MTNIKATKLYNQFVLDAPRVDIFIDDRKYDGDATSLFMTLWEVFKGDNTVQSRKSIVSKFFELFNSEEKRFDHASLEKASRSLEFCTQGALAKHFVQASRKYCKNEFQHLIDGGRQVLEIFTGNERLIKIRKPFKLVEFATVDYSVHEQQFVILDLQYFIDTDHITTRWTLCDKFDEDWVFV